MRSAMANFEELMQRVRHGREFAHASFEPIYYLVFSPTEILEVKRQLPAWIARLEQSGWTPFRFSIAQAIMDVTRSSKTRKLWVQADKQAPLSWDRTNKAIANSLGQKQLADSLATTIADASNADNGIVLVTDLEALHPYTRIGAIETQLYGRFAAPTVIFYPGERTGKTRLSFLGYYPEDGNYRSVHVGG